MCDFSSHITIACTKLVQYYVIANWMHACSYIDYMHAWIINTFIYMHNIASPDTCNDFVCLFSYVVLKYSAGIKVYLT